jgi:hypothetical protein
VIVKGFKKCCISNAMDGRKDGILWEDEKKVENVGSESDEVGNGDIEGGEVGNNDNESDEGGKCEDSDTNWLNWIKATNFLIINKET